MAPLDYTLQDMSTWPQTDALATQQLAWIRAKIHDGIPGYTYGEIRSAATGSSTTAAVPGGWLQKVGGSPGSAGALFHPRCLAWRLQRAASCTPGSLGACCGPWQAG